MDIKTVTAFAKDVRAAVEPLVSEGVAEVQRRQEAAWTRMGTGTRGVTMPSSSFSVTSHHDAFHLNIPSSMADEGMIERIKEIIVEASERHEVELEVTLDVRGGSNYVLEGRVQEAHAPAPRM